MTVCRTLNQSENNIRHVLKKVTNLTPRNKTAGIDLALRNLKNKLGIVMDSNMEYTDTHNV